MVKSKKSPIKPPSTKSSPNLRATKRSRYSRQCATTTSTSTSPHFDTNHLEYKADGTCAGIVTTSALYTGFSNLVEQMYGVDSTSCKRHNTQFDVRYCEKLDGNDSIIHVKVHIKKLIGRHPEKYVTLTLFPTTNRIQVQGSVVNILSYIDTHISPLMEITNSSVDNHETATFQCLDCYLSQASPVLCPSVSLAVRVPSEGNPPTEVRPTTPTSTPVPPTPVNLTSKMSLDLSESYIPPGQPGQYCSTPNLNPEASSFHASALSAALKTPHILTKCRESALISETMKRVDRIEELLSNTNICNNSMSNRISDLSENVSHLKSEMKSLKTELASLSSMLEDMKKCVDSVDSLKELVEFHVLEKVNDLTEQLGRLQMSPVSTATSSDALALNLKNTEPTETIPLNHQLQNVVPPVTTEPTSNGLPECGTLLCWCNGPCERIIFPKCEVTCWCDGPCVIPTPVSDESSTVQQVLPPVTEDTPATSFFFLLPSETTASVSCANPSPPPTNPSPPPTNPPPPCTYPPATIINTEGQLLEYRKSMKSKYQSMNKQSQPLPPLSSTPLPPTPPTTPPLPSIPAQPKPPQLMSQTPEIRVQNVIIGDSNLARSRSIIANRAPNLRIMATSGGTFHSMKEKVKSIARCDNMFIQGGTNDGMQTSHIRNVARDLDKLVAEAKTKARNVILVPPPPTCDLMVDIEYLMSQVAARHNVNFIPIQHLFPAGDRKLYRDRLHPSKRGSGLYGLAIVEHMRWNSNLIDSSYSTSCIACHLAGHSITTCGDTPNQRPDTVPVQIPPIQWLLMNPPPALP